MDLLYFQMFVLLKIMSNKNKLTKDLSKADKSTLGNDFSQVSVVCCTCIIHAGRPAASPSAF
jgi:hypothetical protein